MAGQFQVTVLAFGSAAEALGWASKTFAIDDGAALQELLTRLEDECPRMIEARDRLRFAVNQEYATPATKLAGGDEIAIVPPVSGGSPQSDPAVRLVREPIDVAALTREVEDAYIGAIATFVGVVRRETSAAGRELEALEYSGYEPMALAEMRKIRAAAAGRFDLHAACLVHRLGRLAVGEASVAVVVSSGHRVAAFDACRAMIEELKKSVPIFKQEIWKGGTTNWVEGA